MKPFLKEKRKKNCLKQNISSISLFTKISIVLFLLLLLINTNMISQIIIAQNHPNFIDDENIIIKPENEFSESINQNFDPGDIRVQIKIDHKYSDGILYYNLSTQDEIKKKGMIIDKLDFVFHYPQEGDLWYFNLKNDENVSIKCDIYMELISDDNFIALILDYIIPLVVIVIIIFFIIIYIIIIRKRK
jgi:phage pi2 protein 07